jgi:acyl-CoA reductase-like NAD-dependent aldehyde dehydrogenase
MSDYRVVNPATGAVESEFATATDAQIASVLERSQHAFAALGRTSVDRKLIHAP